MISRVFRLIDTKRIEMKQREIPLTAETVLVRPEYMSICAADQRYYLGQRKKTILNQKLPMALIHEAIGVVLKDFGGKFSAGDKVVLIPLEDGQISEIKGNYRADSKFASSNTDGFMRDIVALSRERLIPIEKDTPIYVFSEILSVTAGAITVFEKTRQIQAETFGVWGDGNMGFVSALTLKCLYPKAKIYVFGKTARKLQKFSFATKQFYIDNVPKDLTINHAFECVGGQKSEEALSQIIDHVSPQGTVTLLGVSENPISINTRAVLAKGLKLIGNSRSDRNDFEQAVKLIRENEVCQKYLQLLISETIEIKSENDISFAFEQDILNDFKTVLKWSL